MSRGSVTRSRLVLLGAVVAAALVSVAGVPVTSAQGTALFPAHVGGSLPVDAPFDPAWDAARPVDVALSGQPATPPMRMLPAFPSIRVRSLVNDGEIALLLEWADPTADDSVAASGRFADAAAVQFALGTGTSICMGQQAGGLNIWHWKADWAAEIAGQDGFAEANPNAPDDPHFPTDAVEGMGEDGFMTGEAAGNPRSAAELTTSVEDVNAVGFGTLTSQAPEGQNVRGASAHRDGAWRVVLSRALTPDDPNDAALEPGMAATSVAFAVWDGSTGDRDGQKSVSAWLALNLPPKEIGFVDMWPFFVMLVLAVTLAALVIWYGSRQPAARLGIPQGGPWPPPGGNAGDPPAGDG